MARFRLPATPPWECDSPIEIADFWEIEALRSTARSASLADLRAALNRYSEVDPSDDAEEDIAEENRLEFAIEEIRERISICGPEGYPFQLSPTSDRVLVALDPEEHRHRWVYLFLLMATRLNMKERGILAAINGPLLFEEVCEYALRNVVGPRAVVHRFGTSAGDQNFEKRLASFFEQFQEYPLRSDRPIPKHGGDDGLDLAVWNQFSWRSGTKWRADVSSPRGKLIVMAQCKTGTSWDEHDLNRLQPATFFDKWMRRLPRGQMTKAFLTACRVEAQQFEDYQADCLFFDRCRVSDYAAIRLPDSVLEQVILWTTRAFKTEDFVGD